MRMSLQRRNLLYANIGNEYTSTIDYRYLTQSVQREESQSNILTRKEFRFLNQDFISNFSFLEKKKNFFHYDIFIDSWRLIRNDDDGIS